MTALVTGASGEGIGRCAARSLRAAGFRVWAGARRPEAMEELRAEGFDVVALEMTDEASIARAVETVGPVDVLVNNAAYALLGPVEELDLDAFRREMETNLFGLVRLTQLVLPGMRERGAGRIVNVGSMGGELTIPVGGAYHASKYALEAITDALRVEVRPFGVRVSLVQPGAVRTAFGDVADASLVPDGSPYREMIEGYARIVQETYREDLRGAIGPERIGRAILHAAISPRPRTRYRVGLQANVLVRLRHLVPDPLCDAAMRKLLGV